MKTVKVELTLEELDNLLELISSALWEGETAYFSDKPDPTVIHNLPEDKLLRKLADLLPSFGEEGVTLREKHVRWSAFCKCEQFCGGELKQEGKA